MQEKQKFIHMTMKNKRWFKPRKIAEAIQEFELKDITKGDLQLILYFTVEDKKRRQLEIAPKSANIKLPEGASISDLKRGVRLIVRASKRRLKAYNDMVVFSEILQIKPPIQSDLTDFL